MAAAALVAPAAPIAVALALSVQVGCEEVVC